MANVDFTLQTAVPAAKVLGATRDFSARRIEFWPTIDPTIYRVHELGDSWAEVTEGSRFLGVVWARERYDWSTHGTVRATILDSNVFRPGGTWELTATEVDGETLVAVRSRRQARSPRGQVLGALLELAGRRILQGSLERTLRLLGDDVHTTGAPR